MAQLGELGTTRKLLRRAARRLSALNAHVASLQKQRWRSLRATCAGRHTRSTKLGVRLTPWAITTMGFTLRCFRFADNSCSVEL